MKIQDETNEEQKLQYRVLTLIEELRKAQTLYQDSINKVSLDLKSYFFIL